jgi:hypothetical protein
MLPRLTLLNFRRVRKSEKAKKREKGGKMSTLVMALGTRQWELAALYLLLGLVAALSRIPADSVEGALDLLEGEDGKKGG